MSEQRIGFGAEECLRACGTASKVTAEDLVSSFLETKLALIREEDEGKADAGRRCSSASGCLDKGELRNYTVPFLGKGTDVKSVPLSQCNQWEEWRKDNKHTRSGKNPKAITIKNENLINGTPFPVVFLIG